MQHPSDWSSQDVSGWFASEKMDGCRGYWDGRRMWSRSGRPFPVPPAWADALLRMHLDGEVWAGRGQFNATADAVVRNVWAPHVCYMVFDAPEVSGSWDQRLAAVAGRLRGAFAATVPWTRIESMPHVRQLVRLIRLSGGEGLIFVDPRVAGYQVGRVCHVLKLKCDPVTGELAWRERIWQRTKKLNARNAK